MAKPHCALASLYLPTVTCPRLGRFWGKGFEQGSLTGLSRQSSTLVQCWGVVKPPCPIFRRGSGKVDGHILCRGMVCRLPPLFCCCVQLSSRRRRRIHSLFGGPSPRQRVHGSLRPTGVPRFLRRVLDLGVGVAPGWGRQRQRALPAVAPGLHRRALVDEGLGVLHFDRLSKDRGARGIERVCVVGGWARTRNVCPVVSYV